MKHAACLLACLCIPFFARAASPVNPSPDLTIEDARIMVPPGGVSVAAGYLTIHNQGNMAHTLVSASSALAETVEFHDNKTGEHGMMQMRQMEEVAIPAGETVTFAPGGMHLMFIGLTGTVSAGDISTVSLQLKDGSTIDQPFNVVAQH